MGPQCSCGGWRVGKSQYSQYLRLFAANYLRFFCRPTSTLLDMLSTPASLGLLDVAPVVAFGFTGPELPAPITVQGSLLQVPITLDPVTGQPKGNSLSLVGGDINIVADPDTGTPATLMAPSGQINLVSVVSPGEILFPGLAPGPNINGASFTTMGTVTLEGAFLDVSGQFEVDADGNPIGGNSGTVFVRGGQLVMDASTILASTVGTVDGASKAVDIQVSQDAALTTGSAIFTLTFGPGGGGDVQLTADTMTMEDDSTIFTTTDDGGWHCRGCGPVRGEVSLMGGSSIQSQSDSSTPGLGQAGM